MTVKANETTTTTIANTIKKAYIEITKQDKDYTDMKLEGAKFQILDGTTVVDTLTTNRQGYAKSKALPIDRVYTVKEVQAHSNYILDASSQNVTFKPEDEGKS